MKSCKTKQKNSKAIVVPAYLFGCFTRFRGKFYNVRVKLNIGALRIQAGLINLMIFVNLHAAQVLSSTRGWSSAVKSARVLLEILKP